MLAPYLNVEKTNVRQTGSKNIMPFYLVGRAPTLLGSSTSIDVCASFNLTTCPAQNTCSYKGVSYCVCVCCCFVCILHICIFEFHERSVIGERDCVRATLVGQVLISLKVCVYDCERMCVCVCLRLSYIEPFFKPERRKMQHD